MILFAVFVALQIADIVTTARGLRSIRFRERNEGLVWLMARVGIVPALVLIKAIMIGAVWAAGAPEVVTGVLSVIYAVVVANNVRLLSRG